MKTPVPFPDQVPDAASMNAPSAVGGTSNHRARVLLVVEDTCGPRAEAAALRAAGLDVREEADPVSACASLQASAVDALVLDRDLRHPAGRDVLERARGGDPGLPILVLGGQGDVAGCAQAIEWGADDYLVRPVLPDELVARVLARIQRHRQALASLLRVGRLELDLRNHQVRADGTPVALTGREFALLRVLAEAGGRTVPRPVLQERLGEWGEVPASNAVDVHVHRIRRKVGRENIHTYRGGYAVAT